ncbi:hypothetical protein PMG11_02669 [Penicillium brasilianum]|uniref:Uncharacterized protein n=1 Tax=Penicillium brasilianum TaxID=104259 RepID=A0A0F7TI97_PENBI|nr:hypothetical protein PMG11_02669 [Penicillium brasilianum]
MHFSSAAALVALSSVGLTYAAPFANPQEEIVRRKVTYQVVNVDGDPASSAAPEIETVTETVNSFTTVVGPAISPLTVTVTAPSSTPTPSSTPHSHVAPPPGASFFPAPSSGSGFFRRGLMAAGHPLQFARGYESSAASVTATPLAARGWYPSSVATPTSSSTSTPGIIVRQFGVWSSSAVASSSSVATSSASLVARQFGGWASSSIAFPSASVSSNSLAARQLGSWGSSGSLSATPSSTTPVSATPFIARDFHNHYYPSVSSSAAPSSSFTPFPSANALL